MNSIVNTDKKNIVLLYITIFSVFLTNIKLYVPLFAINIFYVIYLILKGDLKLKVTTWNKILFLFIIWFFINSVIAILFIKSAISFSLAIKLLLNLSYLLSVYILIENKKIVIDKNSFIKFLQFIILINFIQIIIIYIKGELFMDFFSGNLTSSSDAAYTIGFYKNIIGGTNKNIWASKFLLVFITYLFICVDTTFYNIQKNFQKILFIIMGSITILLILSRTSQLALMVPLVFVIFSYVKKIEKKYKIPIYIITAICIIVAMVIFFEKIFHIKFDMTDGGYTRIVIWIECIKDVFANNILTGSGIGSTGAFIQDIMGRFESNAHNIFITTFYEFGLVGLILYSGFIFTFIKEYINKKDILKYIFIILIPLGIVVNLQYLGYDNDLILLMILMILIFSVKKKEVCDYEE